MKSARISPSGPLKYDCIGSGASTFATGLGGGGTGVPAAATGLRSGRAGAAFTSGSPNASVRSLLV